jgi:hypothetical protein
VFRFRVSQPGRYVVDTRGPTDVYMKLFGPDSPTALIAEDDDSGLGSNARIATDLVEGEYFVQVRHWNRASGVGDYTVAVRTANVESACAAVRRFSRPRADRRPSRLAQLHAFGGDRDPGARVPRVPYLRDQAPAASAGRQR